MSVKTLEEIKASVPIGEYLNGHWEVSELSFKNKGLGDLSTDQTKSLSPTGLDILAVMLMPAAHQALNQQERKMSIRTLEEIKASVSIGQYLSACREVSELSLKNRGLADLSADQTKSLSSIALEILAQWRLL